MREFKTYEACREAAQREANEMARMAPTYATGGCDYGIERNDIFKHWTYFPFASSRKTATDTNCAVKS